MPIFLRISLVYLFLLFYLNSHSQNIDIESLYQIQRQRNISHYPFMNGLSVSVYPTGILMPVSYFTMAYIFKDSVLLQKSWQSVISIGSSIIINTGIKYIINRQRPYEQYSRIIPLQREHTPSFPSGHTSTAFNIATFLSLNYPKWYVIFPSYIYAISVGYSRLYMGVHYPSDVLMGAFVGAGTAYLTYIGYKKYFQKKLKSKAKYDIYH